MQQYNLLLCHFPVPRRNASFLSRRGAISPPQREQARGLKVVGGGHGGHPVREAREQLRAITVVTQVMAVTVVTPPALCLSVSLSLLLVTQYGKQGNLREKTFVRVREEGSGYGMSNFPPIGIGLCLEQETEDWQREGE